MGDAAKLEPCKVLFCGRDMKGGFLLTKEELCDDEGVEVVQCDRAAVGEALQDADVVVPLMTYLTADLLRSAHKLKLILQFGVGLEGVDAAAATEQGVWLSNIPSGHTPNAASCAEMALFLMLAMLRNLKGMQESIQQQRLGTPMGTMLQGKQVLILGFGDIAKELIPRLVPFGVRISALRRGAAWGTHSHPLSQAAEAALADRGTWPGDIARLAGQADLVVVTCKQDATNAGMVGREFLASCKPGVRIVNVARGGLLDYAAVAEGLRSRRIGGMGLDVQFWEPFDPEDYVSQHPSVILTPHVAGVTEQSYLAMAKVVATEVRRLRAGQLPSVRLNQPINPRAGSAVDLS